MTKLPGLCRLPAAKPSRISRSGDPPTVGPTRPFSRLLPTATGDFPTRRCFNSCVATIFPPAVFPSCSRYRHLRVRGDWSRPVVPIAVLRRSESLLPPLRRCRGAIPGGLPLPAAIRPPGKRVAINRRRKNSLQILGVGRIVGNQPVGMRGLELDPAAKPHVVHGPADLRKSMRPLPSMCGPSLA